MRAYADASEKTFTEMSARPENKRVPFAYLALSGGGGDGAFGAGLLNGWTESGKRPEFSLVSGVSTGALIAPFAFVGPEYDAYLEDIYTSGVASTLVQSPSFANVLFGSGLFGDGRLRDLVRRYVTPDLLAAVAAEHAKGRRLLVVTTNLDAQRAVIWNMGAIATSGGPAALDLFTRRAHRLGQHPGGVPAQLIDVQAAERTFQEMHVDGSVVTPVFTLPQPSSCATAASRRAPSRTSTSSSTGAGAGIRSGAEQHALHRRACVHDGEPCPQPGDPGLDLRLHPANGIGFNLAYIDETAPNTTRPRASTPVTCAASTRPATPPAAPARSGGRASPWRPS